MLRFREVETDDADLIFQWRTSKRVQENMLTEISEDLDFHKKWLKKSLSRPDYYHWIIRYGENDIGLVNFSEWDQRRRTTKWGFYIGDTRYLGLGGFVPPFFHNFAFEILDVSSILADVVAANYRTIELHLSQGYVIRDRFSAPMRKNELEMEIVQLELSEKKFRDSKLSRLRSTFPISKWNV